MNGSASEYAFLQEWEGYLKQQNHRLVPNSDKGRQWHLMRSQDRAGIHFIWVIMICSGLRKRFSKNELLALEAIARAAEQSKAKAFVVAKFNLPLPRVVVAGVKFILNRKVLSSDKGGIDWS